MPLGEIDPRRLLTLAAWRDGGRTAVVAQGKRLSYDELSHRCSSLAVELRQLGIDSGVQVALALPNSVGFIVWFFAVLEAGGVVIPLPADLPEAGVAERLATGEIPFLVLQEGVACPDLAPVSGLGIVEGSCLCRREGPIPRLASSGILMRQYSSGSTGHPKEMLKTEGNIAHDFEHFSVALGLGPSDVFLGANPILSLLRDPRPPGGLPCRRDSVGAAAFSSGLGLRGPSSGSSDGFPGNSAHGRGSGQVSAGRGGWGGFQGTPLLCLLGCQSSPGGL